MGKISSPWDESSPPVIQDGNVVELQIFTDKVADLSPIRALSELRRLHCIFRQRTAQRLDLSPLNGMRIRMLKTVLGTVDLSEVKGLPLIRSCMFWKRNHKSDPDFRHAASHSLAHRELGAHEP